MKKIGITGSIGSGKSFVGSLLRERGYMVLDADRQVHELYRTSAPLRASIAQAFGAESLTPEGVDRKYLARLIFKDDSARERLENLVYPYLTKSVGDFLMSEIPGGSGVKFVEAALFSRTPEIVAMLDEIWIVKAPEDVRLRRLIARGLGEEDARLRIQNQRGVCDESLFPGKCVRVLENAEGKPAIESQLDQFLL
jgi:dephospho-CoA kinase